MNFKKLPLKTLFLIAAMLMAGRLPAASIDTIYTHGSFETLGVIVHLSADADGDESATLEYRVVGQPNFRPAHDLVMYDGENMASSIFGAAPSTNYEFRVTLSDPDGVSGANPQTASVSTRGPYNLPAPQTLVTVGPAGANYTTIQAALNAAQPGDEIQVAAGTYGPVSISNLNPPVNSPIVVRAANAANRPIIDGNGQGNALNVSQSSNLVFDGFEIRNGGSNGGGAGARLQGSSQIVLRNNLIHDNGRYEVLVTQSSQFNGGALAGGYHLIENNEIADLTFGACGGSVNSACSNQTYYGIRMDNNAGAGTVIRNNTIYDHVDNAAVCGDESVGRSMPESSRNVLALTGGTQNQGWTNHNIDVYDNVMYDARDDDIEADGICVNARIFRNSFGAAQNPISISPALPGPYFFVRNLIQGSGEASIKFNTASGPQSSITVPAVRNIFFYHNTIARSNQGTVLNLWYAVANDHNVPIKNIAFRNNVFWATSGGSLTDANNNGTEHPSFDYNIWYTPTSGNIFEWWSGGQQTAQNFAAFQQISGQEANGFYGLPGLDANFAPLPGGASQVVDRGQLLPGINDVFVGGAPDLGAFEAGSGGGGSAGTLQFGQSIYAANENAGTTALAVTRSGGNTGAVAINYAVTGGTATAGSDYNLGSGMLNWTNGDFGSKSIAVTLIDDNNVESQETVAVALSNATGGALVGGTSTTTLQINDDDTGSGGGGGGGGGGGATTSSGGGSLDLIFALFLMLMLMQRLTRRAVTGLRRR